MRNPYQLGQVDPVAVLATLNSFIQVFKGSDEVPNYPIKRQSTLDKLRLEIQTAIPLPPTSLANAQELLSKAIAQQKTAQQQSGDGAKTASILLGEVITALQNYIATNGGSYQSGGTWPASSPGQPTPGLIPPKKTLQEFLKENMLLIAAGAVGIYFITRKKGRAK